jgi:chromosome segregation ATPase
VLARPQQAVPPGAQPPPQAQEGYAAALGAGGAAAPPPSALFETLRARLAALSAAAQAARQAWRLRSDEVAQCEARHAELDGRLRAISADYDPSRASLAALEVEVSHAQRSAHAANAHAAGLREALGAAADVRAGWQHDDAGGGLDKSGVARAALAASLATALAGEAGCRGAVERSEAALAQLEGQMLATANDARAAVDKRARAVQVRGAGWVCRAGCGCVH